MAHYNYRPWDFEGHEKLSRMKASWFVSYCYYDHLDWYEKHWENSTSAKSRISTYNNTREYHRDWLREILSMEAKYLGNNKIELSGQEVKKMARKLLEQENLNKHALDPYAGEQGKGHLRSIGEAWFVSYMFYDKVDKGHVNWTLGKKWYSVSTYEGSRHHHHEWLESIVQNPPQNLGDNRIGLSANEVHRMAKQMLSMGL